MQPGSPERGMVVSYLEWVASLPWTKVDGGTIDIRRAREVLDEDHSISTDQGPHPGIPGRAQAAPVRAILSISVRA